MSTRYSRARQHLVGYAALHVSRDEIMWHVLVRTLTALSLAVFGVSVKPKIGIGAVFEQNDYGHFNSVFYKTINENQRLLRRNISVMGLAMPMYENLNTSISALCAYIEGRDMKSLLVIGRQQTINIVGLVAHPLGIPVLGYSTDQVNKYVQIHNPLFLMLKPSKTDEAQAFVRFFSANFWSNIVLFVEAHTVVDGFYEQFKVLCSDPEWNVHVEIISNSSSNQEIHQVISALLGNGARIVVLHTSVLLTKRIFNVVKVSNFSDCNHAWFITENSYTRDSDDLESFPPGTLAIVPNYVVHTDDIVVDGTNLLLKSLDGLPNIDTVQKRSCNHGDLSSYVQAGETMYKQLLNTTLYGMSGEIQFDTEGQLKSYSFEVQNLVYEESQLFWRRIGHIRGEDVSPFGIIWPGESITSHVMDGRKKYRIVTNPVKPFVMEQPPHSDYDDCAKDTTCIYIKITGKMATVQAIQDYENGVWNESNPYEIRCCRGLSVDLLNRLSSDLDFDYNLYIVSDRTYGKAINGTWNGMVRDLMQGTAHMAVAAMSITRSRVKVIDFTNPYFFSGFSVLYTERKKATNMRAFLEPFDLPVWFAIIISATFTAIAMGIFEWNSPFGLNPWGKKRKQNYTLASGMTMVYSVLFGHTVRTKSPKAWPCKVMQNFWAFCCIFIIASYTANLAAFIAGKHAGVSYSSIHDSRLLDIRVGVLGGSAVEGFLRKINPRLFQVCQSHLVQSTDVAIEQLIHGNLDAYLGDYPILDYARAKLDPDCDLRVLSQTFGEDGYGIGLPKGSPLKTPVSNKISEYHESGYIEDLIDVHFADSQCYKQRIKQEDSRLEVTHHAGAFVMLSVGIIGGVGIIFLEHAVFKWWVPFLRKKPGQSFWKSVHLMFFSQRLHRAITSAHLVPAQETCRVLLGIVKNREFARLFQKSTIRTNKLADAAKRKRLNRNFFDVVEKAKWMQEMRANNLFGDDSSPNSPEPVITEISLRDIGKAQDLSEFHRPKPVRDLLGSMDDLFASRGNVSLNTICNAPKPESSVAMDNHCPWKFPTPETGSELLPSSCDETSDDTLSHTDADTVYNDQSDAQSYTYASPMFEVDTGFNVINERVSPQSQVYELDRQGDSDSDDHLFDNIVSRDSSIGLPNGKILRGEETTCGSKPFADHNCLVPVPESGMNGGASTAHNPTIPDTSIHRRCSMPTKGNNSTLFARTRQSFYDPQRERGGRTFNVDKFSKEELLLMWKSSELELNERLDEALKEKRRLEHKLADLNVQVSTPV